MPFSKHSGCKRKSKKKPPLTCFPLFYSSISWLQTSRHQNRSDINGVGALIPRPTVQSLNLQHTYPLCATRGSCSTGGAVIAHRLPAPFENRNHIPKPEQRGLICRGNTEEGFYSDRSGPFQERQQVLLGEVGDQTKHSFLLSSVLLFLSCPEQKHNVCTEGIHGEGSQKSRPSSSKSFCTLNCLAAVQNSLSATHITEKVQCLLWCADSSPQSMPATMI